MTKRGSPLFQYGLLTAPLVWSIYTPRLKGQGRGFILHVKRTGTGIYAPLLKGQGRDISSTFKVTG